MRLRALVTGAEGFVGGILCKHLASRGWDVVGSAVNESLAWPGQFPCNVAEPSQVERLFEWAGPVTHVFHLAAVTFVPETVADPVSAFRVNLIGAAIVADAVRAHSPEARLIYVGSAEAYGSPAFLPITEDHPLGPANPYAISKAAADQYCGFLAKNAGLNVVRARPFNHSGPGQSDRFVLSSLARQIAKIEAGCQPQALQVGNLESRRDFTHVNDVVDAYGLLALKGVAGEAYNVCSGECRPIKQALDRLLSLSHATVKVEVTSNRVRAGDVAELRGSREKITSHTGWQPRTPFDNLVGDLLDYWRQVEKA